MPPSRNPKRVALFAGVNQYKDPTIHELKGAVEDARTLRDFFDAHPGQFDETRLLENPTNDEILDSLDDLTKGLDAGDFLLFFFAGHGVNEGSSQKLLCRDTRRRGGVLNNAFDLKNVDQPQPWHVAAVLDACRTELSVTRGAGVRCGDTRDLDYYDAVISGRRTAGAGSGSISILCSCDKGMTAGEFQMPGESTTHGLFTMAMLNVLRRADESHRGWNFGQDLGQAIAVEMKTLAARSGTGDAEQRPWIEASGDAPLFFKPSLDLEPLRDWVYWFRKDGGITPDEETKCLGVLAGASDAPSAKGIFETIRFFSEWSEGVGNGELPRAYVSTVLRALCSERPSRSAFPWRKEFPFPNHRRPTSPRPPPAPCLPGSGVGSRRPCRAWFLPGATGPGSLPFWRPSPACERSARRSRPSTRLRTASATSSSARTTASASRAISAGWNRSSVPPRCPASAAISRRSIRPPRSTGPFFSSSVSPARSACPVASLPSPSTRP